jgi:hypothetical protein
VILSSILLYVDPTSGSYLIQVAIAAVLGAWFWIKGYWWKIKSYFTKSKEREVKKSEDEGPPPASASRG